MKNFLFSKKSSGIGMLAFLSLIFVVLACTCPGGKSKDPNAKPVPASYFGDWKGQDGSTLSIRGDGTGDYKTGNFNVTGGSTEINDADKTLSITFFGIGKTLKIDQEPKNGQMKLEGVIYKRDGGSTSDDKTTSDSSDSKSPSSSKDSPFPSDVTEEVENIVYEGIVKDTLQSFNEGIRNEDFSDFRSAASKDFQVSLTSEKIKEGFQGFIDKKSQINPIFDKIEDLQMNLEGEPRLSTVKGIKLVNLKGTFPTSPTTHFDLQYEMEKGNWKLLKIKVELK